MGIIMKEAGQSSIKGTGMNHTTWQQAAGKTIFFIRHAEAQHNATFDYTIPDPRLTRNGGKQAQRLKNAIPADALANVQLIVSSPLRRTIQTTMLAFNRLFEWQHVPLILRPDLQETGVIPCDIGSPSSILCDEFPTLTQEINELPANWYMKRQDDASEHKLKERAQRFLKWLKERPEKVIFVVTHNGFLRHLLGDHFWTYGQAVSLHGTPNMSRASSTSSVNSGFFAEDAPIHVLSHQQGKQPGFANGEVRRLWMLADGSLSSDGIKVLNETVNDELESVGFLD
jgi:broad specificity phosphatase PhoE